MRAYCQADVEAHQDVDGLQACSHDVVRPRAHSHDADGLQAYSQGVVGLQAHLHAVEKHQAYFHTGS